jgi:ABC-type microcin C transport system permease subunit YejE
LARTIRFRKNRRHRCKITIVAVLFAVILFSGLAVVDFNNSMAVYGEYRPGLIQVKLLESDIYRVSILNGSFTMDLKYIRRNINSLKAFIESKI